MGAQTMDLLQLDTASPAVTGFDYSQLDDAAANHAKAAVERFRDRQKAYVIDTGRDLLAVKARLEHGLFLEWVQAEMGMTPRSAQRAMAAAEVLGDKSDTVSYLPPTVLYELSAPSTPEPVRAAVLRRIEAGETVKAETILDEVREGRDQARQRAAAEREQARRAALTPEERDEEDALRAKGQKGKEARDRREQRARAERRADERQARDKAIASAAAFVERFGADTLGDFLDMLDAAPANTMREARILVLAEQMRDAPIEQLKVDKIALNGRLFKWAISSEDMTEATALAAEIERDGLLEPLIVRKMQAASGYPSQFEVLHGVKRFLALARVLERSEIPVRIAQRSDD